ncbi:MAG: hypothetical protein WBX25_12580 [Rhodomicrobium sp.]
MARETAQHLTKNDVTAIKRQLISGAASIEDAACRAAGDVELQGRLKHIWRGIRNEIEYLDGVEPRIERPAAGRAR